MQRDLRRLGMAGRQERRRLGRLARRSGGRRRRRRASTGPAARPASSSWSSATVVPSSSAVAAVVVVVVVVVVGRRRGRRRRRRRGRRGRGRRRACACCAASAARRAAARLRLRPSRGPRARPRARARAISAQPLLAGALRRPRACAPPSRPTRAASAARRGRCMICGAAVASSCTVAAAAFRSRSSWWTSTCERRASLWPPAFAIVVAWQAQLVLGVGEAEQLDRGCARRGSRRASCRGCEVYIQTRSFAARSCGALVARLRLRRAATCSAARFLRSACEPHACAVVLLGDRVQLLVDRGDLVEHALRLGLLRGDRLRLRRRHRCRAGALDRRATRGRSTPASGMSSLIRIGIGGARCPRRGTVFSVRRRHE